MQSAESAKLPKMTFSIAGDISRSRCNFPFGLIPRTRRYPTPATIHPPQQIRRKSRFVEGEAYSTTVMAFVPLPAGLHASARRSRKATCAAPRMALGTHVGEDTKEEDYVTLGVAKVFRRREGEMENLLIVEPLPASALDCVARLKVPTSYVRLWATTLGEIPDAISELPRALVLDGETVAWGEAFTERVQASARTYRRDPNVVSLLPTGSIFSDVNHSVERKRLIEDDWVPNFDDNVKQDKSIDVYNRDDDNEDNSSSAAIKDLYNV